MAFPAFHQGVLTHPWSSLSGTPPEIPFEPVDKASGVTERLLGHSYQELLGLVTATRTRQLAASGSRSPPGEDRSRAFAGFALVTAVLVLLSS